MLLYQDLCKKHKKHHCGKKFESLGFFSFYSNHLSYKSKLECCEGSCLMLLETLFKTICSFTPDKERDNILNMYLPLLCLPPFSAGLTVRL